MLQRYMVLSMVVWLSIVSVSTAQEPRRARGKQPTRNEVLLLISVDEVRDELDLNRAQRNLLEDLEGDLQDQMRIIVEGRRRRRGGDTEGQDSSPRRAYRIDAADERFTQIFDQGEELVRLILERPQAERLAQLRIQREGLKAFDRPEFVRQLGLSSSQISGIQKIRAAERQGGAGKTEDEILAVLTDEQKLKWEALKGQPFAFPRWLTSFGGDVDDSDNARGPNDSRGRRER